MLIIIKMRLKSELYAPEQRALCDRVIEILALDEQRSCWLADLDANRQQQTRLLELIPDVRRFFSYTLIAGANHPAARKRPWLSLARGVTKSFYHWHRTEQRHNNRRSTRWFIIPKTIGGA